MSLLALLLAAAAPAAPSAPVVEDIHHERVIASASTLVPWCRAEAEARVVAGGGTPYQWTASWRDRGNVLEVDGRLRVDGEPVAVRCRIARGARDRYATLEFVAAD